RRPLRARLRLRFVDDTNVAAPLCVQPLLPNALSESYEAPCRFDCSLPAFCSTSVIWANAVVESRRMTAMRWQEARKRSALDRSREGVALQLLRTATNGRGLDAAQHRPTIASHGGPHGATLHHSPPVYVDAAA